MELHPISIREADPRCEAAAFLMRALAEEEAIRYADLGADPFDSFKEEDVLLDRGAFVIAYENAQPIGCGALRQLDATTAEINRMYVRPTARRHGVARAILADLEKRAAVFSYRRVCLETGNRQTEAIAFYEDSGYRLAAPFGSHADDPVSVFFEKLLHPCIDSFETDRMSAQRIGPQHLADICRLHSDPTVMKTLSVDGNILSDDVTRTGVGKALHHWDQHGFGLWIFRDKRDGAFIGRGGLTMYEIEGINLMGLAYAVLSDFWGRGLATEIADASLQVGFDLLGAKEIFSWTLPINQRSQRVMGKLGFKHERDVTFAGLLHHFYRITKPHFTPKTTLVWNPV